MSDDNRDLGSFDDEEEVIIPETYMKNDGKKVTLVAYMTGLAHEKPFSHCPRVEGVELFYANTTFKIPATRAVLGMLMRIMQMEPAPKLRLTIELDDG